MDITVTEWLTDDGGQAQTVFVCSDSGEKLLELDRRPAGVLVLRDTAPQFGRSIVPEAALREALRALPEVE